MLPHSPTARRRAALSPKDCCQAPCQSRHGRGNSERSPRHLRPRARLRRDRFSLPRLGARAPWFTSRAYFATRERTANDNAGCPSWPYTASAHTAAWRSGTPIRQVTWPPQRTLHQKIHCQRLRVHCIALPSFQGR